MHKSEIFVIFESPEDTNLPNPVIACKTKELTDKAIETLNEKEPGTRYWYEELILLE